MEANGEVGWKRWRVMCARVRACVWMGVSQWLCDKRPRPSWKLSRGVFTLSCCDPLCFSHTQTHPRCDCTQALDALLRMAGRGHSIRDKENKWEESEVVLCTFFSVQR